MMLRLQRYQFKVTWRKGVHIHIADTLSRAHLNDTSNTPSKGYEIFRLAVENLENEQDVRITPQTEINLRRQTQEDPALQTLSNLIKMGWPPCRADLDPELRPYWSDKDIMMVMNGIIYKGPKAVIPNTMQKDMLRKIHGSHLGAENCLRMAREVLFWPGMRSAIQDTCHACSDCAKYQTQAQCKPMKSLPVPDLPWQLVSQDLFMHEDTHYLVTVDHYSDYVECDELENTLAKTVVKKTKQQFGRHWIPEQVHTDNGPQFTSNEYREFEKDYNFKHSTSSPYWTKGNGRAEAAVKVVKSMMKKTTDINLALLNYRNTPQRGHEFSPAQRLMSRCTRTQLPTSKELLKPKLTDPQRVRDQITMKREQAKYYYDR